MNRLFRKRLIVCLLFACPRFAAAQQEALPDTARVVPLADLLLPCTSAPSMPCEIRITSSIQTVIAMHERLPRGTSIRFSGRGSWTLSGGEVDFAGATVDAPEGAYILRGSARITGMSTARPEWFADLDDEVYPAEALAKAYEAVKRGGTILLSNNIYLSPFFDAVGPIQCGGKARLINSPVTLIGTQRPVPDSDSAPTRLVSGTVIRGEICGFATLRASHLGVDVGPFTTKHHFGGRQVYGIQMGDAGGPAPVRGTTLEDISVLTTGLYNQHSVIIEGQREATVRGLWIWTLGGTHGLVVKSADSIVQDFHCRGASADCLILKSDYATDHAGDASGSWVDGVFISFLAVPGDTAGILLDGSWDSLRDLRLSHIVEKGLRNGISSFDSIFHKVSGVQVSDWSATGMTGPCFVLNGSLRVTVDGFLCSMSGASPGPAIILHGRETVLRRGVIRCESKDALCGNVANDGVLDLGSNTRIEDFAGKNLGGFLVRTSPYRGGTGVYGLDAAAMGGRTSAPYQSPPFSLRLHIAAWSMLARQSVRIVWTAAATRVDGLQHQRLRLDLLVAGLTGLALLTLLRNKRSG